MKKIIYIIIWIFVIFILYYNYWYRIGTYLPNRFRYTSICLLYDSRCFILDLETNHLTEKMLLNWEDTLRLVYKDKEDILFNYLEKWNYNIYPSVSVMLAKILNEKRLDDLREKIFQLEWKWYWEYLISSILSSSNSKAQYFYKRYPTIMNYELSNSEIIRSWFAWFVFWLEKDKALEILNKMLKIEKDKDVIEIINRVIKRINNK